MTFIASVVAKKGVTVIADSLVTTSRPIIEANKFFNYLRSKSKDVGDGKEILLKPEEIMKLFDSKASHTKDYEEKLFQYDEYTAITTSGSAIVNKKRIEEIVNNIIEKNKKSKKSYSSKKFETKVDDFCNYIENEVKEHLNKDDKIGNTTFLITHYSKSKHKTEIYKVTINNSSKNDLNVSEYQFISKQEMPEDIKVVCEGVNRISSKILYGDFLSIHSYLPNIISQIKIDFPDINIPDDYPMQLLSSGKLFNNEILNEVNVIKLTNLSLQQAVDLAYLLMRIEIDFQKYTQDIPTVGGVIKCAIIDANGFKFISGKEIIKPKII